MRLPMVVGVLVWWSGGLRQSPTGMESGPSSRSAPRAASQPTSRPARSVNERLVRKLLGGDESTADAVEETLSRMDQAARRLREKLDPGAETQAAQREALRGVDRLIEQAKKNQSTRGSGPSTRREAERRPRGDRSGGRAGSGKTSSGATAGQGRPKAEAPGQAKARGRPGEKAELSRGWGYLPLRDREEIAQGFDDEFLPKYREAIARYYEDLARIGEAIP